jgi:cation transport regulator ChaB
MDNFKQFTQEKTGMRIVDLLPKKVKHALYRLAHKDKYKAALNMYHELKKDKDVKSRGLKDFEMQDIAADAFKLNHKEFRKILNRRTRYT